MIAKIRLITNAEAVEQAYADLDNYNDLDPDERRGKRKPKIPKIKYSFNPIVISSIGVKGAYQEGDVIQVKHSDFEDWLPLKNEPAVWAEISKCLSDVRVRGFGEK